MPCRDVTELELFVFVKNIAEVANVTFFSDVSRPDSYQQ